MALKKQVPNIITLLNLSSGLIALTFAFNTNYQYAFMWVALGIFFDFWDGFAARMLKAQSPVGLQLDSLADMVTSGVVPGLVMYQMLSGIAENLIDSVQMNLTEQYFYLWILPYLGFVITLASAYRLAKFNVDTRQTDSFIGLPTPANALWVMSLPLIAERTTSDTVLGLLSNPFILVGLCLISAFLLNSNIHLFSLKIKHFDWETHKTQVIFLVISAVGLALLQYAAIPLIILLYIALSLFTAKQHA
jgi:CDP-diacylglycerol--serine O-phosphatidyltransferase